MAKNLKWQDDYWLLLMQIFLQKPVGMKPTYCREMVSLALELHIPPQVLKDKMKELARLDTPRIERIWETYNNKPQKLARAVRLLREMKGFGQASLFYEGVETNETWEKDWQPVAGNTRLTPVMLILVLDLYFRLTPATMVTETPEVKELSIMLKISTENIVEVMDIYLHCDPYLNRRDVIMNPLLQPCLTIWQRYGNGDTEELAKLAEDLKVYYL